MRIRIFSDEHKLLTRGKLCAAKNKAHERFWTPINDLMYKSVNTSSFFKHTKKFNFDGFLVRQKGPLHLPMMRHMESMIYVNDKRE